MSALLVVQIVAVFATGSACPASTRWLIGMFTIRVIATTSTFAAVPAAASKKAVVPIRPFARTSQAALATTAASMGSGIIAENFLFCSR